MTDFIVSIAIKQRKKLKNDLGIVRFAVGKVKFELMPLSNELKDDLQLCMSYQEALFLAAEHGVVIDCKRASEDEEYSELLEELWGDESMDIDCDPCVRQQVGLKVCEISGLAGYMETVKEVDEEKKAAEDLAKLQELGHVDGDKATPDVLLDQLNNDVNTVSVTNTL